MLRSLPRRPVPLVRSLRRYLAKETASSSSFPRICVRHATNKSSTISPTTVKSRKSRAQRSATATAVKNEPSTVTINTHPDLPSPSDAQHRVLTTLLTTSSNIVINACAGSGKTTTILHMASAAPHLRFLVLLYNRRLMLETIERVEHLGLANITVINYHSLGVRSYSSECATDIGLRRVVLDDAPLLPGAVLPECDVLVMDEQQDMTPCLKRFTDKLLRDMDRDPKKPPVRIVALGDERQEMYGFNNSDARFLTYTAKPEVFGYLNKEPWVEIDQPLSNRVTQQNIDFINEQLLHPPLGGRKMFSGKPYREEDPKPRYLITDTWTTPLNEVRRLLDLGLRPDEIIILAPSVRGRCPIIRLMNTLALLGYPVHVADSDISEVNPEVSRGKILACTYHQAKGIEREAAIIFGFDISYHVYYHRTSAPMVAATNAQYVAATRAKRHLILLHDQNNLPLPFMNLNTLRESCDVIVTDPPNAKIATTPPPTQLPETVMEENALSYPNFSVTSLTRNLPSTVITSCLRHLQLHWISDPHFGPTPPGSVKDVSGLTEGISEITGTAVPPLYQYRSTEHYLPARRQCSLISTAVSVLRQPFERVFNLPQLSPYTPASSRKVSSSFATTSSVFAESQQLHELRARLLQVVTQWRLTYTLSTSDILFLAAVHSGSLSNLITKLLSIPVWTGYDWLKKNVVDDITHTLRSFLPRGGLRFEAKLLGTVKVSERGPIARVKGSADVVKRGKATTTTATATDGDGKSAQREPDTVWEIKYTDSLAPQHVLQTAVYAALLAIPPPPLPSSGSSDTSPSPPSSTTSDTTEDSTSSSSSPPPPPPNAILVNARTSQALSITGDFQAVLEKLVRLKTGVDSGGLVEELTDKEFLQEARLDWKDWESEVGLPRWFSEQRKGTKWDAVKKAMKGKKGGSDRRKVTEMLVDDLPMKAVELSPEPAAKGKKKGGRPKKVKAESTLEMGKDEDKLRTATRLVKTVVEGRTKEGRKVPVTVMQQVKDEADEVEEREAAVAGGRG